MTRPSALPAWLPVLAAALAGGCSPTLVFSAHPQFLCPPVPASTTLAWDTNGDATLAPPQPGLGVVSGKGQRVVAVAKTTDFVMTVRKSGKTLTGTQHVTVLASDEQRLQLDPKSCSREDASDGAHARAVFESELPAADWPEAIKAARVALSSPQPGALVLDHAGKQANVKAGDTAAAAVAGTALGGTWRATLELGACDGAPDTVIVVVKVACAQ